MEDDSFGPVAAGGAGSVDAVLAAVRAALTATSRAQVPWLRLDEYLADLAARNGARHVATTSQQLRALAAACPSPSLAEVRRWRAAALAAGSSRSTVNHYVGRLRTFLRWLGEPAHECARVEMLDVTEADLARRPRALGDLEMVRFLRAVDLLDAARDRVPQVPVWRFLAETGMRWSEAAGLDVGHLRGDCAVLPAALAKSGKGRKVGPLSTTLLNELGGRPAEAPRLRAPRGKAWREVGHRVASRSFELALARAGLPRIDADGRLLTIHSLRRGAGTAWLRAGVPIEMVSRLLGHGSTSFTERVYLDLTLDDPVAAVRAAREREKSPTDDPASAAPPERNRIDGGPPR